MNKKICGKYLIYFLLGIDVVFMFLNFIICFIFSLFLIMVLISSKGYGSPEEKWQAYTVGMGNWRIGGIGATSKDYSQIWEAEMSEKGKIGGGDFIFIVLIIIIMISIISMILGYGSILSYFQC